MSHCIIKSLPDMGKARNRVDQSKVIYDDFKPSEALLSFAKGKKYLVKTFGCQGNVRDEEVIARSGRTPRTRSTARSASSRQRARRTRISCSASAAA